MRFLVKCDLNCDEALKLLREHLNIIKHMAMQDVPDIDVHNNYDKGFCVASGRDKRGRPLIWVRYKYIVPGRISFATAVKSTWLSLDANIQCMHDMKEGITIVYDFNDIGVRNLTVKNIFAFKDSVYAVVFAHPSRFAKAIYLDPPNIFKMAWAVGKLIVPTKIKNIIDIVYTDENPRWYEKYADITQMPCYWVGAHNTHAPDGIDYKALLTRKVERDTILY